MYQVSKGIVLSGDKILDKRIGIVYSNDILQLFLSDVKSRVFCDIDDYLENLNLDNKKINYIKECIDFCMQNNLIVKKHILLKTIIWSTSKFNMLFYLIITFFKIGLFILPFFLLNILLEDNTLSLLIELYFIHILSILIHEIGHSITYWIFQKKYNGYFDINVLNCSFVYNDAMLKKSQKIIVAGFGSIYSIIFLFFSYFIIQFNQYLILFELFIQALSLTLGSDGKIIRKCLISWLN